MRTTEARGGRAGSGGHRGSTTELTTELTTEDVGTPCIDGMTLSAADVQRTAEKLALQQETIRKAIYAVAGRIEDARECRELFEMMGIDLASVRAAREAGARR